MTNVPITTGAAAICLDTSALIHLNDAGALEQVAGWFPSGSCYTAEVVVSEELPKALDKYPQNKAIIDASWLRSVSVEDEALRIVGDLRHFWGSRNDRGAGEAEVLTLCDQNGWTAVWNDRKASVVATRHGIASVCTPSLIVAATAQGHLTRQEGWDLHCAIHARFHQVNHTRSNLPLHLGVHSGFHAAFDFAVTAVQRWLRQNPKETWPRPLAMPSPTRLDDIVYHSVALNQPP